MASDVTSNYGGSTIHQQSEYQIIFQTRSKQNPEGHSVYNPLMNSNAFTMS